MIHHPSCQLRQIAAVYDVPIALLESNLKPCRCADQLPLRGAWLIKLLWQITRRQDVVLLAVFGVAIAGLLLGLSIGWLQ